MRYPLTGYVLEIIPTEHRITVRNTDVPNVMESMVMDYRVNDTAALTQVKAGDEIAVTIVIEHGRYSIKDLKGDGKH